MYWSTPNKEISELTGWGYGAIVNQAKVLKLKKDPALKFKIGEKEIQIIKDNYLTTTSNAIGRMIGVNGRTVRTYMQANGWVTPAEVSAEATYSVQRGKTICTPDQDQIILAHYMSTPVTVLAAQLGISTTALYNRYRGLGLTVPQSIVDSFKQRYKLGDPSPHKGKKQTEYMSSEAIERTKATRFKKGQLPHNTYDRDGALSIRKISSGKMYLFVRISIGVWEPYHIHLWEQAHGKLKYSEVIMFIDGDQFNCQLSNMRLMTRSEWQKEFGPMNTLEDHNIARWLSYKGRSIDKDLEKEILDNHPGLIEMKRKQLELNRELKKQRKNEKRSNH